MGNNAFALPAETVAQEDLVMFINACLSCTGQREFYEDSYGQTVSIDFLHDYILGNYRLLYSRTLAAGINHFNQAQIILKLLATGKQTDPQHRDEENQLITAALHQLPPNRAWGLLLQIRKRHINNRRARAIAQQYVISRGQNLPFQAVKYRSKLQAIATHNHLNLNQLDLSSSSPGTSSSGSCQNNPELNAFLFRQWDSKFETDLFEKFRQGYYSATALYKLPFTVAEGLAVKHGIPRDRFLKNIEARMTTNEKLRLQNSAAQAGINLKIDPSRLSLTKLALYVLSLSLNERQQRQAELHGMLRQTAQAVLQRSPLRFQSSRDDRAPKITAVLDRSYSSSGSHEKRRRPLGIALAIHYLLSEAAQPSNIQSQTYQGFWTVPLEDNEPLQLTPRGQTDLATPLLTALKTAPDIVIVISDGWENDPPGAASELIRVYRDRLDPTHQTSIVHCNPVFNADDFGLKSISPLIPTVGLREAEDLSVVLRFARFAEGSSNLAELEAYLEGRSQQLIEQHQTKAQVKLAII